VRTVDQQVTVVGGQTVTRAPARRPRHRALFAGGGLLEVCAQQPGGLGAAATLPPPETTTVRIVSPPACDPGLMLAGDYLREEGFTDVRYMRLRR